MLVSSILTLSPLATAAQAERSFARLGSRDGLASDTVYAITQDRAGFIWLATGDGLNRYDGSRFVLFEHDPQGNDVIADSSISTMILDRQGRIWVGTWGGGADIIDPVSGAIENLRRDEAAREGIGDDRVQTLFEDASGAIWIGTFSGGLTRLDRPNGSMLRWHTGSPSRPLSNDRVWALAQSGDGAIWVGTGRGLDRLSGTDSVEHLEPFANDTIRALLTDRTGQLWIATERTIARIDPRSRALIRDAAASALEAALSVELVTQLFEDEGGAIWIGTQASGVFRFDPARGSVEHFEPDPARTGRLSHANVRSFFEDRSHVLWIGTRGGGVNRLDLKPAKFHALTNDPTDPRSLSPGAAAFIEDASGDIFVATDDGIDRFDRESHAITHLWQSDSPMRSVRDATSFFRDSRGTLWAGTWSTGLYRFDADQRVTRYEASGEPPLRLSSNRISEILEGRGGEIWVATAGGLDRIDPDRGVVMSYRNDPSDPRSLSENFVTTLFIDRAGTLWVGTDNAGLNHFDAASSTFSHFRRIPEVETSLSSDRIRMLHEDGDGILWIATGNGLNHLDPHTGTVRRYFAKDGLAHSRISSIVPDGEGMFWLGTPRGVTRFDPRNGKTRNYTIDDGLHGGVFVGAVEELGQAGDGGSRRLDDLLVVQVEGFHVGLGREPDFDLRQVFAEHFGHLFVGDGVGWLAAADEHLALRGQDFFHRPAHEDDAVLAGGGQVFEQGGDDFDGFALGVFDPGDIAFFQLFDLLQLEIALGVVFIGGALVVGDQRDAAGFEHFHHHGCARARQPGDDGDVGGGGGLWGAFEEVEHVPIFCMPRWH